MSSSSSTGPVVTVVGVVTACLLAALPSAGAAQAAETARRTFEEGSAGASLPTLAVAGSIGIVDALVGLGFAASKGEARRLIAGGGARVAGEKVGDETTVIVVDGGPVRVSAGKKHHGMILPA